MILYKKNTIFFIASVIAILIMSYGCTQPGTDKNGGSGGTRLTAITFVSAVQIGGTDEVADSTGLTLTFSADPTTLTAANITITGATKGALTGSGTTRTLAISNITVGNGQTVSVAISNPNGYTISGSPKTVVVYRALTAITFVSAVQIGGTDGVADSTGLILTFSDDPTTLTADNINLTGATKGALTGSGTTRTLAISNITVGNGQTVSVAISNPSGYTISGSPKTAVVYKDTRVTVNFVSVVQIGGTDGVTNSTGLTLTFSADPTTITADNITLTGATKGALTGSGTTRTLAISNITVDNGQTVSVAISNPSGYNISGSPKTAVVYRSSFFIGMPYQGGIIAYIFQPGDPGYVSGQTHGLIASTADLSTGIQWYNRSYKITGATGTALGTGRSNTTAIVYSQGSGSYAAQLCEDYINIDTGTGVYSDWYLPSIDELNKLYLNRTLIGVFAGIYYWSSSEDDINYAWYKNFYDGSQYVSDKSNNSRRVRAVRSF